MKLYRIAVAWRQAIVEWLAQDESRVTGHRQRVSVLVIVAPAEDLAVRAALKYFEHREPELLGKPREEPVHLIIDYDEQAYASVSSTDPEKG